MNKSKKIKIISIVACIVLVIGITFTFCPNVLADVGNNNRYESTSSSSDGDSGDIFWILYMLFDILGPIPTLIIIAAAIVFFMFYRKSKAATIAENSNVNRIADEEARMNSTYNNTNFVANQIREIDPAFSSDAFIGWVREVFLRIEHAWSSRKWEEIRPFESNELFNQHNTQLNEYIENKKINKVEKIAIKSVNLVSFVVDGDKEVLTVNLDAILRDYVVDEETNKVLESSPDKDWYMRYVMVFNRKVGVKTEPGMSNKSVTNCPNCGAPTDITSAGRCEYCKSVITTGEHDWVLSDIRKRD